MITMTNRPDIAPIALLQKIAREMAKTNTTESLAVKDKVLIKLKKHMTVKGYAEFVKELEAMKWD